MNHPLVGLEARGVSAPVELSKLGASRCRLEPADAEGRARLQLEGRLPRGWSVRLTRALARRGVSLISGQAKRRDEEAWVVGLELALGHADGQGLDFLELARREEGTPHLGEPRILDFQLVAEREALHLEVHAWDAVGLLASVLERVWAAGLRPDELYLETESECAFHSLVLKDEQRRAPGSLHERLLARSLARMVRER